MKKKILAMSCAALLAACGGGGDDPSNVDTGARSAAGAEVKGTSATFAPGTSQTGNPTAPGDTAGIDSQTFLATAFQTGAGAIAVSRLALQRASDDDVKEFAQRLIDHHTQANAEITRLAAQENVTLPTGLSAEYSTAVSTLTNLNGGEFDRAYMAQNVTAHRTALGQFRAQAMSVTGTGTGTGTATGTSTGSSAGTDTGTGAGNTSGSTTGTAPGTTTDTTSGPATGTTTGTTPGTGAGSTSPGTGSGVTADPDISTFAANALPALQTHLLVAKMIHGTIDADAFVINAYLDGLAEIQASTLALQKATSPEVRAFAQRMIDDHTDSNEDLVSLARDESITLPTEIPVEHQSVLDDLSRMSGADFDKAYMNHNVLVHESAVQQAREQATDSADSDIQLFAVRNLPTLIEHREDAGDIYTALQPSLLFAAFQDGMGEIMLSKLALQESTNTSVQQFAQRMIDEHTAANNTIVQLAQQENVVLPREIAAEHLLAYVAGAQLTGAEFDAAFMQHNVDVHTKAVQRFQQATASEQDPEIRAFATATLPTLQAHLQSATQIRNSLGTGTGTGTTPPTGTTTPPATGTTAPPTGTTTPPATGTTAPPTGTTTPPATGTTAPPTGTTTPPATDITGLPAGITTPILTTTITPPTGTTTPPTPPVTNTTGLPAGITTPILTTTITPPPTTGTTAPPTGTPISTISPVIGTTAS